MKKTFKENENDAVRDEYTEDSIRADISSDIDDDDEDFDYEAAAEYRRHKKAARSKSAKVQEADMSTDYEDEKESVKNTDSAKRSMKKKKLVEEEEFIEKETEEEKRFRLRKKVVKRFATIFIVVLLLLTFFSNTILNYSLPEVSTTYVSSGKVSQKVRCQGTVEVGEEKELTVSGTRVIKDVLVSEGDEVKEGDVIVTFEESENSELKEAEERLEELQNSYDRTLLQRTTTDYTDDNIAITNAQTAVTEAAAAVTQAKADESSLAAAKTELANAQAAYDAKAAEVANLQSAYNASYADASIEYYNSLTEEITGLQNNVTTYESQASQLTTEIANLEAQVSAAEEGSDERAVLEDQLAVKKTELESVNSSLETARSDLSIKQASLDSLAGFKDAYTQLENAKNELSSLESNVSDKQSKVAEYESKTSVADAQSTLTEAQQNLDSLQRSLTTKKNEDSVQTQITQMDDEAALKEIEEQKELIEKLKAKDDTKELKATADGIITGLSVKTGSSLNEGDVVALIQIASENYSVQCTITKNEARLLSVGNEATIENIWSDDVTATVKSIKADTSNPNQSSIVTFEVSGDVSVGETLMFAVGGKSASYDTIVPNNAVKEDSEGKFVLVVKVKSTPIGNRYVVKKVQVEVEATDTTNSAISGDVVEYDNVVTNSSKPLDNGQQVRLSEDQ